MNGNRWRRAGYGAGGLIALAVLFLGVVMLSNIGLRGMRLDLTQNKLYTLSTGTRQVLRELKEPVNLYFYFSRDAAEKQSPLIMPYANRVREFLEEITAAAVEAGATTINLPDTVGYATPKAYGEIFSHLLAKLPILRERNVVLSSHCHDDLGLAVANSIAAVQAGARQVECTINGIGERAGNA